MIAVLIGIVVIGIVVLSLATKLISDELWKYANELEKMQKEIENSKNKSA